jgi:hypothetical protein
MAIVVAPLRRTADIHLLRGTRRARAPILFNVDAWISRKQEFLGAKTLRCLRPRYDLAQEMAQQLVRGQVLLDRLSAASA